MLSELLLTNVWGKLIFFLIFRNRIIPKRINVRIEHVKPSKCREDFVRRVKENDRIRKECKLNHRYVELKRVVSVCLFLFLAGTTSSWTFC